MNHEKSNTYSSKGFGLQYKESKSKNLNTCVFVGGPIQHAMSNAGFDTLLQELLLNILAELKIHGYQILSAHLVEEFGQKNEELDSDIVTRRDFHWMQKCDVFVAVLPLHSDGQVFRSDGTHVELGWAMATSKPVVLVAAPQQLEAYSHLIRGMKTLTSVEVIDFNTLSKHAGIVSQTVKKLSLLTKYSFKNSH